MANGGGGAGCLRCLCPCGTHATAHKAYQDRALRNDEKDGLGRAGDTAAAADAHRSNWATQLQRLDVLTAYRPFDIIDYYFEPHTTGPSISFLIAAILIVVMYACTVFLRDNSRAYLVRREAERRAYTLPSPTGIALLDSSYSQFSDASYYFVVWEAFERAVTTPMGGGDAILAVSNASLGTQACTLIDSSRAEFKPAICPLSTHDATLESSIVRTFNTGSPSRDVVARVVRCTAETAARYLSESTTCKTDVEINNKFTEGYVRVVLTRFDTSKTVFRQFLDDGIQIITVPGRAPANASGAFGGARRASSLEAIYAPASWRVESRISFGTTQENVAHFRAAYDTPYTPAGDAAGGNDTTLFAVRFSLTDEEVRTQFVFSNFLDSLGFICGLAVTLWNVGYLCRRYNRSHFRRHGTFRDANMDPFFLKNFLDKKHEYTPPGVEELSADGRLSDAKAADQALADALRLARRARQTLHAVLQAQTDLKDDLNRSTESRAEDKTLFFDQRGS